MFASADARLNTLAIADGLGIGFLPVPLAEPHPELELVTHVDLHWTAKVQAILHHLRALTPRDPAPAVSGSAG